MAFWIAILIGIVVGLIYTRQGMYEAVILAFNLTLSIYLALYLAPILLAQAPTAVDIPGGLALAILILFALCFGILFAVSFVLFTGQFTVPMAKALDWLGGGILGLFSGFLGASFILMILTFAPIPGVPDFAQNMEVAANTNLVCSTCDKINYWVGTDRLYKTNDLLTWLHDKIQEKPTRMTILDPNLDPNTVQIK